VNTWSCWLPDPAVWLRSHKKKRALEDAVLLNPQNLTARRDLAVISLERKQPRRAITSLVDVQQRESSAETEFLLGWAYVEAGDNAAALPPLQRALSLDAKLRYGDPHLLLGRAHAALGQLEQAQAAFEAFLAINTSSLEGQIRLARVKSARNDDVGARAARTAARTTYRLLPGFQKRRQRAWWLRSFF
jgi:hypothetical protein